MLFGSVSSCCQVLYDSISHFHLTFYLAFCLIPLLSHTHLSRTHLSHTNLSHTISSSHHINLLPLCPHLLSFRLYSFVGFSYCFVQVKTVPGIRSKSLYFSRRHGFSNSNFKFKCYATRISSPFFSVRIYIVGFTSDGILNYVFLFSYQLRKL